jgi:hypothetical protein
MVEVHGQFPASGMSHSIKQLFCWQSTIASESRQFERLPAMPAKAGIE